MDNSAIAFKHYRDRQCSLESFQRVTEATFVALETHGLRTKKIDTFRAACLDVGYTLEDVAALEQAVISMELNDVRRIMSKFAVGANIQKVLDFIIRLFERLLGGSGNQAADNAAIVTSELNKINKEYHTRKMPYSKPKFNNDQDRKNFDTQWGSYRDTIGRIDPRAKDMDVERFYMTFTPSRGRELSTIIATAVTTTSGIPKAYSEGNRTAALKNLNTLLDNVRASLADFRSVEIKDQDTLKYRQDNIEAVTTALDKSIKDDWVPVRKLISADYIDHYSDDDINVLKNINAKMINITSEIKRMSKYVDLEQRIAQRLSGIDDDAERERVATSLRNSVNHWSNQLAAMGQHIGRILSTINKVESDTANIAKAYRRTVDIIINR